MERFENLLVSESRRSLALYERAGRFLFHGSPNPAIEALVPHQGKTWKDGICIDDGQLAVAASPYADIAIFRALITGSSGFSSFEEGEGVRLEFRTTRNEYDDARERIGYVYVLNRSGFMPRGSSRSMDWRSLSSAFPIDCIQVRAEDLPKRIRFYKSSP